MAGAMTPRELEALDRRLTAFLQELLSPLGHSERRRWDRVYLEVFYAPNEAAARSTFFALKNSWGQRFLGGVSGVAGKVVSGWGINGITTFRSELPLGVRTAVDTSHAYGGALRPNLVPGCNPSLSGSGASRIGEWFNTSCFTQPAPFTFGDLSRTMGNVRAAGINNWDFALFKNTKITERLNLQFRAEFFNLFNRVQFGEPGQTFGSGTFGVFSSQENSPRLIQFALRLDF